MTTRACGACGLCCKLPRIDELAKPAGCWCPHWQQGRGCTVYDDRPGQCRAFVCGWLAGEGSEAMRPDRCHVILTRRGVEGLPEVEEAVTAIVDPHRPRAWQQGAVGAYLAAVLDRGDPVLTVTGAQQQLHTRDPQFAAQLRRGVEAR